MKTLKFFIGCLLFIAGTTVAIAQELTAAEKQNNDQQMENIVVDIGKQAVATNVLIHDSGGDTVWNATFTQQIRHSNVDIGNYTVVDSMERNFAREVKEELVSNRETVANARSYILTMKDAYSFQHVTTAVPDFDDVKSTATDNTTNFAATTQSFKEVPIQISMQKSFTNVNV